VKRQVRWIASIFLAFNVVSSTALAQNNDHGAVRIMTYNLDEGTDYQEALGAALFNPAAFPAAVQLTMNNVRATNPPARMAAIASEIAAHQPDLVGVQEATQWRTSGTCADSTAPEFDLLQSLLAQLSALGEHYDAIAVTKEFDFAGFTPSGSCVRATNQDAILARTDLAAGGFQLANVQSANFQNVLTFSTSIGPLKLLRGWASVDAVVRGQSFRFITTHLEDGTQGYPFSVYQQLQASELLQKAGSTDLPIIIAADFNVAANNSADPSYGTYRELIAAGLADQWQAGSSAAGLTCCQSPLLTNMVSSLSNRIDLVFASDRFVAREAQLVGTTPSDVATNVFWPSDHAGVFVKLKLPD